MRQRVGAPTHAAFCLVREILGQVAGGVVDVFADEVGVSGVACGLFEHVEDRPPKGDGVAEQVVAAVSRSSSVMARSAAARARL